MSVNRIQILNWRQHGDDESYVKFGVFAADDLTDCTTEAQGEVDEEYDWDQDEDPESREDWEHVIYVNDDITIEDGQILEHNGRKFKVTITEVKE